MNPSDPHDKDTVVSWNCRHHPIDGWHEVGCPHQTWTSDQLLSALVTCKAGSQVAARTHLDAMSRASEKSTERVNIAHEQGVLEERERHASERKTTARRIDLLENALDAVLVHNRRLKAEKGDV